MTLLPKFKSYQRLKPGWKIERTECHECDKRYTKDYMMGKSEGRDYNWYCIRCYNFKWRKSA